MKRLGVFLLPLNGMLVQRRSLPRNLLGFPQQFAGTHLYSWVERGTVRVKCLAQEHNTMSNLSSCAWVKGYFKIPGGDQGLKNVLKSGNLGFARLLQHKDVMYKLQQKG